MNKTSIGQRRRCFNTAHWAETSSLAPNGVVSRSSSSPVRRASTKKRLAAQANKAPSKAAEASDKDHTTDGYELGLIKRINTGTAPT
jgi:hypothetical protein